VSTTINLFSKDPQLAQLIRELGMTCSSVSSDGLSALVQSGTRQPNVLVVDLRDQPQLPPAIALLKRQHPTTGVLLVAAQLDPALMLEAMRAGVNEFVTHPVSAPELQAAVKRLAGNLTPSARGDIYAFIGAKGGVGTTTVAVNVATALAEATRDSTLLVDMNMTCGDAAVFLGAEPRFSVVDALENVQRLDTAFFSSLVVRSKPGLDLLGASARPAAAQFVPTQFRALFDFAAQAYRHTVLDLARSDTTAMDSLDTATRIVIVVNQELATVRNASRLAATLRQRYGAGRLSLVLSRTDRRAEIGHDDVERTVGMAVSHTFPSDYRLALQAMNKGRPIVLDHQNELSAAFSTFARDLGGVPEIKRSQKAAVGSIFGRLAPRRA
jgi:pilus assembly protein CpaE